MPIYGVPPTHRRITAVRRRPARLRFAVRPVSALPIASSTSVLLSTAAAEAIPPADYVLDLPTICFPREIVPDPCDRTVTRRNWEAVVRALQVLCEAVSTKAPVQQFATDLFEVVKIYPGEKFALADRLTYSPSGWVKGGGEFYVWDWSRDQLFVKNLVLGAQGAATPSRSLPIWSGPDGMKSAAEIILLEGRARFIQFTLTSTFSGSPATATAQVDNANAYWGGFPNLFEPAPLLGGVREITLTDYIAAWGGAQINDKGYAVWDEVRGTYVPLQASASGTRNAALVRIAGAGCTVVSPNICRYDGFTIKRDPGSASPCAFLDDESCWVMDATQCDAQPQLKSGQYYVAVHLGTHDDGTGARNAYYITDPLPVVAGSQMDIVQVTTGQEACIDFFQNAQCVYDGFTVQVNLAGDMCSPFSVNTAIWMVDIRACSNPQKVKRGERYLGLRLSNSWNAGGALAARPLYAIKEELATPAQVDLIQIEGIKESQNDPDFVKCDLTKPNAQCAFHGKKIPLTFGADLCDGGTVGTTVDVWCLLLNQCLPKPELRHGERYLGLKLLDSYTTAGATRPLYAIRSDDNGHRLVQAGAQSVNTCKEVLDDENATGKCFWLGKIVNPQPNATGMCNLTIPERYDCILWPMDVCDQPKKLVRGELFFGYFIGSMTYQSVTYPVFAVRVGARIKWARMLETESWWHGVTSDFVRANPCEDYQGNGVVATQTLIILLSGQRDHDAVNSRFTGKYQMPLLVAGQVISYERAEDGTLVCMSDYLGPHKYTQMFTADPKINPSTGSTFPAGYAFMDGIANAPPLGSGCDIMTDGVRRHPKTALNTSQRCDKGVGTTDHSHDLCSTVNRIVIANDALCFPECSNPGNWWSGKDCLAPNPPGVMTLNCFGPDARTDIPLILPLRTKGITGVYNDPCSHTDNSQGAQPDFLPPWYGVYIMERIDNSQNPGYPGGPALPPGAP